ncbi:hypothetical protein NFI96_008636 [Prochilodus magdalenae]|nr:hypothetical protein NFI96_008636 [Prochilodus magdalenae]
MIHHPHRTCSVVVLWGPDHYRTALTASESDGSLLIEQYAPCPYCSAASRHTDPLPATSSNQTSVHYFNMEDCVLAAAGKKHITCPNHPKEPVPLQELVPELFMTDFPSRGHRTLPTGGYPTGRCPQEVTPQDAAHRTLPTGESSSQYMYMSYRSPRAYMNG